MRRVFTSGVATLATGCMLAAGCGNGSRPAEEDPPSQDDTTTGGTSADSTGPATTAGPSTTDPDDPMKLDVGSATTGMGMPGCDGDDDCELIDLLFVVDNSGTMGEEQLNLARNFGQLVERLENLQDGDGNPINPNVNIAVTTSDFGHPLCTPFHSDDYTPAAGRLIFSGCNSRISAFDSIDPTTPVSLPEACTESCPMDLAPGGAPFIHFDATGTNVPFNDVAGALSCVGPQGINGCGFEQPLESMLHALRPDQCWNDAGSSDCADDPDWGWVTDSFVREGSILAIAIITDEADCSVLAPDGFDHFKGADQTHWGTHPDSGEKTATSRVCWSGGVNCVDDDGDGVYESCDSNQESEVLHPVSRYTAFLDYLKEVKNVEIVMLGVLGVPPVTEHMDEPPFAPLEGGIEAVVYRDWVDGEYDGTPGGGDILPADWADGQTAAHKQFEFGIGPGCTGETEDGGFTGQALPPVRIRDVCQHLDETDADGDVRIRCCIESICDADFSPAIDCLTGIISEVITPVG